MNIKKMLLFVLIPFFSCVFSQDFIQEPNIIQLEEYTNVICSLNSTNYLDLFKKYYFIWYDIDKHKSINFIINIKNDTIDFNRDIKKFKTFTIDDKFILQIKNLTEDDKKRNLYCYYNDHISQTSYVNKFKNLTDLKFFNPFSSKNMKIEYVVKKMKLRKINIKFNKIFPIPKCFIKINDKIIWSKHLIRKKSKNYIYSKVNLRMNIKKVFCSSKTEIICNLMNKNFIIDSKNNTCNIC